MCTGIEFCYSMLVTACDFSLDKCLVKRYRHVEALSLVGVVLQVLADIEDDSIGLAPLLSLGMCKSYCFT